MKSRLHGLYVITDSTLLNDDRLTTAVEQAIAGGARIVQYRDKSNDPPRRLRQARHLSGLCRQHDVIFIINDDVSLAAAIGADGVHLGRDDGDIASARKVLGDGIIGVSCYNQWPLAESAVAKGADYIAFGAFFPSATKPDAVRATPELLERSRAFALPVAAIGGITPENGRELIEAGADMLAVVQGVFARTDIETAARRYAALF